MYEYYISDSISLDTVSLRIFGIFIYQFRHESTECVTSVNTILMTFCLTSLVIMNASSVPRQFITKDAAVVGIIIVIPPLRKLWKDRRDTSNELEPAPTDEKLEAPNITEETFKDKHETNEQNDEDEDQASGNNAQLQEL